MPASSQTSSDLWPLWEANNFDALRFWAALLVLWSHSIPLSYGAETLEPLFALSGGQATIGTVAVSCFFAMSGYLVTRSFERSRSPWLFIKARVLRVMPALLVVLIAVAFIVGPLVSTFPPAEYLSSPAPYRYVALQASFLRFPDELPGIFTANPNVFVNGSLWTLRHEVECYALVFLLGVCRLLNRYTTLGLYLVGLVGAGILDQNEGGSPYVPVRREHLDLVSQFLAGALIYQWRLTPRVAGAWFCVAVAIACAFLGGFGTAQRTVIPYIAMFLAIGTPTRLPSLARFGDLSYGIYIYAWPVTQLIVMSSSRRHWLLVGVAATPIVLVLAWLSWNGVEKRALAFKQRPLWVASGKH